MKRSLIISMIVLMIGAAFGIYYLFEPHRDVAKSTVDHEYHVQDLVNEYLTDPIAANNKYLSADGESTIFILNGSVERIRSSSDGRTIVVLKEPSSKAGFQCLFNTTVQPKAISIGSNVSIKGVLRAGPGYDDDLEMFENGYMEECTLIEGTDQ